MQFSLYADNNFFPFQKPDLRETSAENKLRRFPHTFLEGGCFIDLRQKEIQTCQVGIEIHSGKVSWPIQSQDLRTPIVTLRQYVAQLGLLEGTVGA